MRTQVGIIGAGPAGLLLSHLLARSGIDSVVVEIRSRAYCEARQRAGVLEAGSVAVLRAAGLSDRLDREGLEHGGIYLQFDGERHHVDFRDLTGRTVTVYAQTEVVKDLIAARVAAREPIEFDVSDAEVSDLESTRPVLRCIGADGERKELVCDAIAGCDGFHGICRPAIPTGLCTVHESGYPYAWLGILADVPPSTDELIYCHHGNGFALHSMRTPQISRLYLQVAPDEDIAAWPDDRIWGVLRRRFGIPGWELKEGPVLEKSITPMRSFVAAPMRYGRLFLAGDSAHIVPPTGAKGLNLAASDVLVLARALKAFYARGRTECLDEYSDVCVRRVWKAQRFSWWMTSTLHRFPDESAFDHERQIADLDYLTSSRAAMTSLAEQYVGLPMEVSFDSA